MVKEKTGGGGGVEEKEMEEIVEENKERVMEKEEEEQYEEEVLCWGIKGLKNPVRNATVGLDIHRARRKWLCFLGAEL